MGYELKRNMIDGVDLAAPVSYWEADPYLLKERTGGCGPGKFGDFFVPDTVWGLSIFRACQIHDWMYSEGYTADDKKIADSTFLDNMLTIIEAKSGWLLRKLRSYRAMTYYIAVRDFGTYAFAATGMTDDGERCEGLG